MPTQTTTQTPAKATTSTSTPPSTQASFRQSPHTHSLLALGGYLLLCYSVAGLGAVFTLPSISTWYAALVKPGFNPPNAVFGPVWTALYGLMAIAAWLVWRTRELPRLPGARPSDRTRALALFGVQLLLNFLWTPTFFALHRLLPALVIIVCLWVAIVLTTLRFWRVDRLAAVLLLPYLAWVSFATALNFEIYRLN